MNKHLTLKKYILLAIFVSMMAVLSYLDRLFSAFIIPFIPVIGPILADLKIGFCNIIVLIIISRFNFIDSLIAVILKSIIIGFIYSSITSFLMGLSGTILSFLIMKLLAYKFKTLKSYIFISACGGFFHMFGQILTAIILYGDNAIGIIESMPLFLIFGLFTGIIIGLIYMPIEKHLKLKDSFIRKK